MGKIEKGAASLLRPGTGKNPQQATTCRAGSAHSSRTLLIRNFPVSGRKWTKVQYVLTGAIPALRGRKIKRIMSNPTENYNKGET
jgi:hypothetical protein